jgi:SulP family sulfate permease
MRRGGYLRDIGEENLFPVKTRVIAAIYPRLDPEICRNCRARIFRECQDRLPDGRPRSPERADTGR